MGSVRSFPPPSWRLVNDDNDNPDNPDNPSSSSPPAPPPPTRFLLLREDKENVVGGRGLDFARRIVVVVVLGEGEGEEISGKGAAGAGEEEWKSSRAGETVPDVERESRWSSFSFSMSLSLSSLVPGLG